MLDDDDVVKGLPEDMYNMKKLQLFCPNEFAQLYLQKLGLFLCSFLLWWLSCGSCGRS